MMTFMTRPCAVVQLSHPLMNAPLFRVSRLLCVLLSAALLLPACGGESDKSSTPGAPALSISGTPPSQAMVGQQYSFTPQASGGSGGLQFSAQNLPGWMSLQTSTGRLSGTPGSGDIAAFGNIRITVTDGVSSRTLGPFEIVVMAPNSGSRSVTLSWQAPTERADGTPLIGLAGFRILYGTASGNLDRTIQLANPGLSRYVVENLMPGNWYFAMTAYDQAGLQSSPSPTVQANLN
jgi:hypothetical protein